MRTVIMILALVSSFAVMAQTKNIYSFVVEDIEGKEFPLSQLEGKKVLIVNTASKCGLTPQYTNLEKLYQTYRDSNFVIIGFPANNFLKQEPGSNEEIAEFCQKNYGVSFPMMGKISVKGDDIHPLYKWLTESTNSDIQWNFQKYMIDEKGMIVGFVSPKTNPLDEKITKWIEGKK